MKALKNILDYIFVALLLVSGLYITIYYWLLADVSELRNLPTSILSTIILYIFIQLIKRNFKKKMDWQDWSYYIALIAVLLPLLLVTAKGDWIIQLAQFGSLFFLLPPVVDLIGLLQKRKQAQDAKKKEVENTDTET